MPPRSQDMAKAQQPNDGIVEQETQDHRQLGP
jgi:hypothetical protein